MKTELKSTPISAFKSLSTIKRIEFLIELYEEEEKELRGLIKPHLKNQEYHEASRYQVSLNNVNEFLRQLKLVIE